jgi:hypothetical protein
MPLWGTDGDTATNKPKWLPDDANSDYDKTKIFANQSGWVQRAGTAASGSDNASAQEEVLVAIGGLAGATAAAGLKHPTLTNWRLVTSAAHGTSNNIVFELAFDERITYTAGAPATYVLTASAGGNVTATVTHINGTAIADGAIGNVLRFKATSGAAGTFTLAANVAMQNRTDLKDTVSGTDLELASGKLTAALKTAIGVEVITIAA